VTAAASVVSRMSSTSSSSDGCRAGDRGQPLLDGERPDDCASRAVGAQRTAADADVTHHSPTRQYRCRPQWRRHRPEDSTPRR